MTHAERPGGNDDPVVFPYAKGKIAWAAAGCLIFVLGGAYMFLHPERLLRPGYFEAELQAIGAFCSCFFLLFLIAYLRMLMRRHPRIVVDASGLRWTALLSDLFLAWSDVDDVVLCKYRGQIILGIVPVDEKAFLSRMGPVRSLLPRVNHWMGAPLIGISQNLLEDSGVSIQRAIKQRLEHYQQAGNRPAQG